MVSPHKNVFDILVFPALGLWSTHSRRPDRTVSHFVIVRKLKRRHNNMKVNSAKGIARIKGNPAGPQSYISPPADAGPMIPPTPHINPKAHCQLAAWPLNSDHPAQPGRRCRHQKRLHPK